MPSGSSKMAHDDTMWARRGKQHPQDGPKRDPRGVWGTPRAAHGPPRGPKGALGAPKWGPRGARRALRGRQDGPRGLQRRPGRPKMRKAKTLKNHWFLLCLEPPGHPKMSPKGSLGGTWVATRCLGSHFGRLSWKPGDRQAV